MKLHSTVLFVRDIERSKEFYTGLLGFSIEHDFGKNVILDNGLTIWEIRPDHVITKSLETADRSNRFELYFEDESLEEISNRLHDSGVTFLHRIHEEPWGQRTLRFFDPDHHLVEIGEPLEIFVMNMSRKGLTAQEIFEKSGIPVDTVKDLIMHCKRRITAR